jgi:hypothetical protein
VPRILAQKTQSPQVLGSMDVYAIMPGLPCRPRVVHALRRGTLRKIVPLATILWHATQTLLSWLFMAVQEQGTSDWSCPVGALVILLAPFYFLAQRPAHLNRMGMPEPSRAWL